MNISLRSVKMTPRDLDPITIDNIIIRGNSIRQIYLPDSLPLDTLLIDDLTKPKNRSTKERAGRGNERSRTSRGQARGRGRVRVAGRVRS